MARPATSQRTSMIIITFLLFFIVYIQLDGFLEHEPILSAAEPQRSPIAMTAAETMAIAKSYNLPITTKSVMNATELKRWVTKAYDAHGAGKRREAVSFELLELLFGMGVARFAAIDHYCPPEVAALPPTEGCNATPAKKAERCRHAVRSNVRRVLRTFRSEYDRLLLYKDDSKRQVVLFARTRRTEDYMKKGQFNANPLWLAELYTLHTCNNEVRLCAAVDGCRFVCNPTFLRAQSPFNVVSIGSNNEWDFEESVVDSFGAEAIGTITTMDCTLQGRTNFTPPTKLTNLTGFKFMPWCINGTKTNTTTTFEALPTDLRTTIHGANPVALRSLVGVGGDAKSQFRGMHILKMDVEGYEYVALRDALVNALTQEESGGGRDFTTTINAVHFLMELHLNFGPAKDTRDPLDKLAIAHLAVMTMHALGFSAFKSERNPYDGQCTEMAFVRTDWLVQSNSFSAVAEDD